MQEQKLLERVCSAYRSILGPDLTGIYLHGSIAFGCYDRATGDVDFLVVVRQTPSPAQKEALVQTLLALSPDAPAKGFEMSVVLEGAVQPFVYPTPFELHYSEAHRARAEQDLPGFCRTMNGVDPDLAAHVTVLHHVGITLTGSPIGSVFGPVPRRCYADSILADVEDAQEEILRNPVYIVLNLCRVLAFLDEGAVLSKAQGGQWGLAHLPERYHPLLRRALAAYAGQQPFGGTELLEDFARELLARIRCGTERA